MNRKLLLIVCLIGLAAVLPQQVFANPAGRLVVQGVKRVAAEAAEQGGGAGARAGARAAAKPAARAAGETAEQAFVRAMNQMEGGAARALKEAVRQRKEEAIRKAIASNKPLIDELGRGFDFMANAGMKNQLLQQLEPQRQIFGILTP